MTRIPFAGALAAGALASVALVGCGGPPEVHLRIPSGDTAHWGYLFVSNDAGGTVSTTTLGDATDTTFQVPPGGSFTLEAAQDAPSVTRRLLSVWVTDDLDLTLQDWQIDGGVSVAVPTPAPLVMSMCGTSSGPYFQFVSLTHTGGCPRRGDVLVEDHDATGAPVFARARDVDLLGTSVVQIPAWQPEREVTITAPPQMWVTIAPAVNGRTSARNSEPIYGHVAVPTDDDMVVTEQLAFGGKLTETTIWRRPVGDKTLVLTGGELPPGGSISANGTTSVQWKVDPGTPFRVDLADVLLDVPQQVGNYQWRLISPDRAGPLVLPAIPSTLPPVSGLTQLSMRLYEYDGLDYASAVGDHVTDPNPPLPSRVRIIGNEAPM